MKKIIKSLFIVIIAGATLSSCQEAYEADMVPGNELAGEWYVQTYLAGNAVLGHQTIMTYNTAAATGDTIWLDDLGHIWPVKAKIPASAANNTFAGTGSNIEVPIYSYDTLDVVRDETIDPIDSVNQIFEGYEKVTVEEGKIIPGEGRSKTGVVVDSIYIRATFTDDPSNTYEMSGHRRTGFEEDDY